MTETTYDIIAKSLDRISMELHQADENNDFLRIGLLSGQLKTIKEDLSRLLWIELPELNDSHKIEAVSKSTTGSKNGTQKANKSCLIEKFEEAMQ